MAVIIDAADLSVVHGIADAPRLRAVCLSLVEQYAPGAPDHVKSEAVIRTAAYLNTADGSTGALQQIQITGGSSGASVDLKFRSTCSSALRYSGAAALLSPWRKRRAVSVAAAS